MGRRISKLTRNPGPTCSDSHIPGFIKHPKIKGAGKVFVVSVNDPFVYELLPPPLFSQNTYEDTRKLTSIPPHRTNAWGKSLDAEKSSGIRFLADASGAFTRALDVEFPSAPFLGTNRSKRYALVIEGGKVKSVNVEPDNIGADGESSSVL
jgi:2-Cys peroxiredoxin 5